MAEFRRLSAALLRRPWRWVWGPLGLDGGGPGDRLLLEDGSLLLVNWKGPPGAVDEGVAT